MGASPKLDPIFHQPIRTRLAAMLRARPRRFSELRTALEVTDGNLDAHMKKLGAAGYLHSTMVAEGRVHQLYELSSSGRDAFDRYAEALEATLHLARAQLS